MLTSFEKRKQQILKQLNLPTDQYNDLSPKGSIDEGIRELIHEINSIPGLVTTSSCAGRISVFLEGEKKREQLPASEQDIPPSSVKAGPGGKGGGSWLFVSHDPLLMPLQVKESDVFHELFGMEPSQWANLNTTHELRLVHFKFEAMILHLLTASLADSQIVLTAASSAGFRESGAVSLSPDHEGSILPMAAIRSTGLGFDSIIGYQDAEGRIISFVTEEHLKLMVNVANQRFKVNTERIQRFRTKLLMSYYPPMPKTPNEDDSEAIWEDKDARRARKRAEGIARQQALLAEKQVENEAVSGNESYNVK